MTSDQLSMFGAEESPARTQQKGLSFTLSKTINAPAQKVYDQWLIPVFVGDWMFGPKLRNEIIVSLENEVRKGGTFAYTVNRREEVILFSGKYLELDIPHRLRFSWCSSQTPKCENQMTVSFLQEGDRTRVKLTLRLDPQLNDSRESIKQEWAARCNALAEKFSKK